MAKPVWQTPEGDLGIIAERQFYNLRFDVLDPDQPLDPNLTYTVTAGDLPRGLSLKDDGFIEGTPTKNKVFVRGVPLDVGQNETSRFAVRVSTPSGHLADRTFQLTVTGQNPPDITTLSQRLGIVYDGTYFSFQLEAVDLDPDDTISWELSSGELPPGLTVSTTGLVSGYITPQALIANDDPGFDKQDWDEFPWDNSSPSINKTYSFEISATDGKDFDVATYTIEVLSKDSMTADTTDFTADHDDLITTDTDNKRLPVLRNPPSTLGTILHDNYFAYKFDGWDPDNDAVRYALSLGSGSLYDDGLYDSERYSGGDFVAPPGLTLNTTTGWLHGYIPIQTITQQEFTFGVKVEKVVDPDIESELSIITVTLVTDLLRQVTWSTPAALGTIENGAVSELYVEATNPLDRTLYYRLKRGSTNRLPQGLKLLDNGLIVGRCSFNVFQLDGGDISFDSGVTSFDTTFTSTIEAYDLEGEITVTRDFTITVSVANTKPYEDLYFVSRTKSTDRTSFTDLLANANIFASNKIYRSSDPYFGKQTDLRFLVATGLEPKTVNNFVAAMSTNHYNKKLTFGDVNYARALDSDGTTRYEVVYIEITDDQENVLGVSTSSSLDLSDKIDNTLSVDKGYIDVSTGNWHSSANNEYLVYPNSILNMQQALVTGVGQSNVNTLPDWQTSKQENNQVLNYKHYAILAYVTPGSAEQIAFLLNRHIDNNNFDFKDIKWETDRYVHDLNLSKNYDKDLGIFTSAEETTFDIDGVKYGAETTFDGQGTKFVKYKDIYEEPDQNDKYLVFPRRGIFGREPNVDYELIQYQTD